MKQKQPTLNPENLSNTLWDTLLAVKAKTLDVKQANAIASASREICRVAKTQLDYIKASGKRQNTKVKFLGV